MMIIVGLGNPGPKYKSTRHNVGFQILDALLSDLCLEWKLDKKTNALIAKNDEVILVKPQDFMNNSGDVVIKLASKFHIPNSIFLVIHDEIDLPLGVIRVSKNSGAAGHKGIESIIEKIGRDFTRLRVGIENREQTRIPPTEDYVLENFTEEEEAKLKTDIIPRAIKEINNIL